MQNMTNTTSSVSPAGTVFLSINLFVDRHGETGGGVETKGFLCETMKVFRLAGEEKTNRSEKERRGGETRFCTLSGSSVAL